MNLTLGVIIAAAGVAAAAAAFAVLGGEGNGARQAAVARKGATVMPFDLARTTHFFDDRKTGGIETVTANDSSDTAQVGLIRAHLSAEAKRFAHGDFSDPANIHGQDMPGLAQLANAGEKLHVTYKELPAGARITYASGDKAIVGAIHQWFAAQRSDHGAHMHMGHSGAM